MRPPAHSMARFVTPFLARTDNKANDTRRAFSFLDVVKS